MKIYESKENNENKNISSLYLSENFRKNLEKILEKGDSKIAKKLLESNNNDDEKYGITYIDRTDADDGVTFISSGRLNRAKEDNPDIDPYNIRGREPTKIGRLIRRLYGTKFDQASVEIFVNKYKTIIRLENQFSNFDIVKGEDIKYWYSFKNYNELKGSLGGSCMQGDDAQKYFKIYTKNENQVRLCILKNDNGDKIKGRAIVWNLTNPSIVFMDRIYVNDDADVNLFIEFAKKNNWYCKERQTYRGDDLLSPDGKSLKEQTLEIVLENNNFNRYPYMDTMRYYYDDRVLCNNYNNDKYDNADVKTLTNTDGYYTEFDGDYEPTFVTDWRGNEINEDDAVWCEYDDVYCLRNEAIRVSKGENGRGRHFIPDSPYLKYSEYSDSYYHIDDVIYSDFLKDWVYKKYAVKMYLDKDKKEWKWTHKLTLHDYMGKIDDDYFINSILYRDENIEDGEVVLGDYHFKDDDFEKLPKVEDKDDYFENIPDDTDIDK